MQKDEKCLICKKYILSVQKPPYIIKSGKRARDVNKLKKICITAAAILLISAAVLGVREIGNSKDKNKNVSISVAWGSEAELRAEAPETIGKFRKQYGDIEVKPDTWILDTSTYYMKAATGRLPTLFYSAMTESERFKRTGFNLDLEKYIKKYEYDKYMRQEIKNLVSEGGKYYSVPSYAYLLGVVFNAELFEEAGLVNDDGTYKVPKTYEELAEYAQIITERTGVPGFLLETDKRLGGWLFTNIAWAYGTEFIKYENGKWYAAFNSPECIKAFQYMKDLRWKYKVIPDNYDCDQNQAQRRVLQKECAMIIDGGIGLIYSRYKGDKNAVGMFSMPEGPAGKYSLLGGVVYGMSNTASDEELDAAFKWIEYDGGTPNGNKSGTVYENKEKAYQKRIEEGQPIGLKNYSIWTEDCPARKADNEMREKYKNVPDKLYKDYNDMIDGKIPIIIRAEEKVSCQDLYYILTECLNEIFENPDVDLETLTAQAAEKFQTEYLDKIN